MSGVVTEASGEALPDYIYVGQDAVFQVQDNGEGAGADPDMVGDVYHYSGASCSNPPTGDDSVFFPPYLAVSGNIQVR
jgi:hypothetical protein